MNKTIFVTGHKNPDSDSICSALAYANLKQLLGESAIAVRLGALNDESKYILKRFDVEGPFLLKDARSQLRDIAMDEPTLIPMSMTMAKSARASSHRCTSSTRIPHSQRGRTMKPLAR